MGLRTRWCGAPLGRAGLKFVFRGYSPSKLALQALDARSRMCEADPASASTGEEGPSDACPPRVRELLLRPRLHEGAYDRSVFTVDAFASAEECEALVFAAHRLLDSYGTRDVQPARSRLSIVSQVDKVLRLRLLALIEAELPAYADAAG